MKIISASFLVRLDDESDLDAVVALDELLMAIGFDGPVDTTSVPDARHDVTRIEFEPAAPSS